MLRRWRLVAGLISVFGLVVAMIGAGTLVASAGAGPMTQGIGHVPQYICHATDSDTNPYVTNEPDISSIVKGEGHDSHNGPLWNPTLKDQHPKVAWGDIIPPFNYVKGNYPNEIYNGSYPGQPQPWTAAAEAIFNNGCNLLTSAITTAQQPATATVGDVLKDQATLTGVYGATGSITFTLYNPAGVSVHTEPVTVSGNGGTYTTPTGHVANAAGTWHWQAAYSGDSSNTSVTSDRSAEPVVVDKMSPRISTEPSPSSVNVGGTLKDSATLAGGYNPTGSITFTLYDPSDVSVHTESVTVNGNGVYTTPTGHVANTAGTWHWKAEYSGDGNNKGVASAAVDEPVTVSERERAQPTITTTPNPTSAKVGATLKDSATLSGGNGPTGTITFTLLDPSDAVAHTETVDVDGAGTYITPAGHVAGVAGTWHWEAEYSGDSANKPAASEAGSEPVTITADPGRVQPTITTNPNPKRAAVGATLKDSAVLSGGNSPSGSIVFTLYNPSGVAVHTEEVTVSGNGTYATPTGHIAATQGTWHWKADYSGDAKNLPASSNAADEPVVVGPGGGVLAATGSTSPGLALSAGVMALGLLALLGAFAWRRREA